MKICGIVAASGSSSRFGSDKLSVLLNDKPVLAWSVSALANHPKIDDVVVASFDPPAHEKLLKGHVGSNVRYIKGGDCREESVILALEALPTCDAVLVHDGARPFLFPELVDSLLAVAKESACVVPVMPISSALKKMEKGSIAEHIKSGKYSFAQTPQLCWWVPLKYAFKKFQNLLQDFPDESAIMAAYGVSCMTIPGSPFNIKLTYQDDLNVAKIFANSVFKSPQARKVARLR